MRHPTINASLASAGVDVTGTDYSFAVLADMTCNILPEPHQEGFIMFAKCLFQKRGDPVYMDKLLQLTFDCPEQSFFVKRMAAAGCSQADVDTFLFHMKQMFNTLRKRS